MATEDIQRASPEALLALAKKEGRGKLKIFLGAAPGVGKTYAMLVSARGAEAEGRDVVAGVVDTNVSGSRHPKRCQDIDELLAAGIDVWTTLNIQHLESLNDVVQKITRVRVRETVPDRVFENADEIVLVDLPPDELLKRLAEGKVYIQDTAVRAVEGFFKPQNLTALRELLLRRAAERID